MNLIPAKGVLVWPENEVQAFIKKIYNQPLTAKIIKISSEGCQDEKVYELDITYGFNNHTGSLRQWLIDNSLAEPFDINYGFNSNAHNLRPWLINNFLAEPFELAPTSSLISSESETSSSIESESSSESSSTGCETTSESSSIESETETSSESSSIKTETSSESSFESS